MDFSRILDNFVFLEKLVISENGSTSKTVPKFTDKLVKLAKFKLLTLIFQTFEQLGNDFSKKFYVEKINQSKIVHKLKWINGKIGHFSKF